MMDAATQTPPAVNRGLPDYEPPQITTTHPALLSEEAEAIDAEEEEDRCCYVCGKSPCEWLEFGLATLKSMEDRWDFSTAVENGYVLERSSGEHVPNNTVRFTFYKFFTYEKFGHLGRGNRVKIPNCVEGNVKAKFPDLDGNYTNFIGGEEV
jgi:hypothetical protein